MYCACAKYFEFSKYKSKFRETQFFGMNHEKNSADIVMNIVLTWGKFYCKNF